MARGGYGNPALQARAEAQARANGESIGTKLERAFSKHWWQLGQVHGVEAYPPPQEQYVFAPPRRYRFDFAFPAVRVAIEMEGGIYLQLSGGKSRHTFPPGFIEDCRKYALAASKEWLVFRLTGSLVEEAGICESISATIDRRRQAWATPLPMETQLTLREIATNG